MSGPLPLITSVEEVTPDWLTHALNPGRMNNLKVESFSARRIGTGQVGQNVRLELKYAHVLPSFEARFESRLEGDVLALTRRFKDRIGEWAANSEGPRCVVHGDYRLDNMLFGCQNGGVPLAIEAPGAGRDLCAGSRIRTLAPEPNNPNPSSLLWTSLGPS